LTKTAASWFAVGLATVAGPFAGMLRAQGPTAVPSDTLFTLTRPAIPELEWHPRPPQSPTTLPQQPTVAPPPAIDPTFREEAIKNATAPCIEPPPMVSIDDYDGPLQKVVGTLARPLERKSVHPPHFKSGTKLCTLTLKGKFLLFVADSLDPVTFLDAGFQAGLDQAEDSDHSYGQGAEGYGRRFGAEYAGDATSRFFGDFLYPAIFSEDPRYYRLAHGSARRRFLHAVGHVVVAHNDNGNLMFNFAEWLGTSSSVVLANTYHPDNRRGFTPAAESVISNILQDAGFDVLREFWPEISRKFKLPFRGQTDVANEPATAGSK
jgi:hypothetical protein